MAQTMIDKSVVPYHSDYTRRIPSKSKTLIVVYDQPKVVVVRRYTQTVIPHVDPDKYRNQFDHALLDTSTLLDYTRRLNIQEKMITPPKM